MVTLTIVVPRPAMKLFFQRCDNFGKAHSDTMRWGSETETLSMCVILFSTPDGLEAFLQGPRRLRLVFSPRDQVEEVIFHPSYLGSCSTLTVGKNVNY
jgi:hypothetical protein